jgi:hypothetical protein
MMGFTEDHQLHPELLEARDRRFNISTDKVRDKRRDIPAPSVDPMANAWQKDKKNIRQFIITTNADSAMHKHPGNPPSKKH